MGRSCHGLKGIIKLHVKSSQPSHQRAGEEGTSRNKKKKTRHNIPLTKLGFDHVSSPTPINQSQPLHALANEAHAFEKVFIRRLDVLRNQTNEESPIHHNVVNEEVDDHLFDIGGGNGDGDRGFVDAGHGDNTGFHLKSVRKPAQKTIAVETAARDSVIFHLLTMSFLTMVFQTNLLSNSHCGYCVSLPRDEVRYRECKKESSKLKSAYDKNVFVYDQISKDYDGALNHEKELNKRVKELEGDKKGLEEVNMEQADRIKHLEEELKKFEDTHQLRVDREKYIVECGNREMVRRRIINEYLLTFVCRLHRSAEYKRSLGEVSSLAVGNGFINGVSTGRKDEDV
nr:hypothetical protein [Tanacetum cinerariifolium]